jgi:ATP-binding cassette subfamily B (MDR/TAP) protein 1
LIFSILKKHQIGKSTIIALIERFYDPDLGSILVGPENINLKTLNTNYLHNKVALVSQEPVLFGGNKIF